MNIDDLYRAPSRPRVAAMDPTLYCSFCGKSQHEVRKLVAGSRVFICDGCVDLCHDLVHDAPPLTVEQRLVRLEKALWESRA